MFKLLTSMTWGAIVSYLVVSMFSGILNIAVWVGPARMIMFIFTIALTALFYNMEEE